jgi:hypothetical protein
MDMFKDQCPPLDGAGVARDATAEVIAAGSTPRSAWEVDDESGHAVYRGGDLELAEEIYHSLPGTGHLFQVASPVTS